MPLYVVKRIGLGVITIWGIVSIVFVVVRLLPGDPATILLGQYGTPELVAALRTQMGLDQPIVTQYVSFLGQLLGGDLGVSPVSRQPVAADIAGQWVYTVQLAVTSLVVCLAIGLPTGALAALHRGRAIDAGVSVGTLVWLAMPDFWLGLMALLLFAVNLGWFPMTGVGSLGITDTLYHLVLPAFVLGTGQAAIVARMFRSAVLEVVDMDHVRTARSKGVRGLRLIRRHVLRNALPSIVNISIINAVVLMAGSVVIETVFSRPGVGRLLVTSVGQKDYPTIQGCLLFFAASVVVITLIADIVSAALDPRLRGGLVVAGR
jgi:peptide/nickel transport system permease protein